MKVIVCRNDDGLISVWPGDSSPEPLQVGGRVVWIDPAAGVLPIMYALTIEDAKTVLGLTKPIGTGCAGTANWEPPISRLSAYEMDAPAKAPVKKTPAKKVAKKAPAKKKAKKKISKKAK